MLLVNFPTAKLKRFLSDVALNPKDTRVKLQVEEGFNDTNAIGESYKIWIHIKTISFSLKYCYGRKKLFTILRGNPQL